MRKFLAVVVAVSTIYGSSAQAHQNSNNHRHPHQHSHNRGNDWALPFIGGLIIGGVVAGGNNNYYYERPYNPRPVRCYREYTGEFWNGWEWVQTYRKVCY